MKFQIKLEIKQDIFNLLKLYLHLLIVEREGCCSKHLNVDMESKEKNV